MPGGVAVCCDEFSSALEATFANPIDGPTGWLLYGTDHDSVIKGQPEQIGTPSTGRR